MLDTIIKELINLIFYTDRTHRFLSFTQAADEVSLIIDKKSADHLPKEKFEVTFLWIYGNNS